MVVARPYRRTVRQFADGRYSEGGRSNYITHPKFALEPEHYVRAFLIIQKDLFKLFDYIEPDDVNLVCYSYRMHELFVRVCIEVEANFKAIPTENGYARAGSWNISDYRKIEASHFLSTYEIKIPVWRGGAKILVPFEDWTSNRKPTWYQDYHAAKHNRHGDFAKANFENLLRSVAGLLVLLSAQFLTEDFSPHAGRLVVVGPNDGFEEAIGGHFRVKLPENWPATDRYEFNWPTIGNDADPFVNYPYPV